MIRGTARIRDVHVESERASYHLGRFSGIRVSPPPRLIFTVEMENWVSDEGDNIPRDVMVLIEGQRLAVSRRMGESDESLRARAAPPAPEPPRTLAALPVGTVTHNPEPPAKTEVERPDSRFGWLEID